MEKNLNIYMLIYIIYIQIYTYIYLNHLAVYLKLTQQCKLTIPQVKKWMKSKRKSPHSSFLFCKSCSIL